MQTRGSEIMHSMQPFEIFPEQKMADSVESVNVETLSRSSSELNTESSRGILHHRNFRSRTDNSRTNAVPKNVKPNSQHRNLEDVDYWRHRAGWFDDDEAMKAYNEGVYDTFYSTDDDRVGEVSTSTASQLSNFFGSSEIVTTSIKVFAGIVGVAVFVLLVRAMRRRSQGRKKTRKISNLAPESSRSQSKRSSSRSRSRSKSKLRSSRSSRSRSRRRKSEKTNTDTDDDGGKYNLMDDGEAKPSRTSRSKSRTRSSRSRSRARKDGSTRETMLV